MKMKKLVLGSLMALGLMGYVHADETDDAIEGAGRRVNAFLSIEDPILSGEAVGKERASPDELFRRFQLAIDPMMTPTLKRIDELRKKMADNEKKIERLAVNISDEEAISERLEEMFNSMAEKYEESFAVNSGGIDIMGTEEDLRTDLVRACMRLVEEERGDCNKLLLLKALRLQQQELQASHDQEKNELEKLSRFPLVLKKMLMMMDYFVQEGEDDDVIYYTYPHSHAEFTAAPFFTRLFADGINEIDTFRLYFHSDSLYSSYSFYGGEEDLLSRAQVHASETEGMFLMSNPAEGAALKQDGRIPLVLRGIFRALLERKEAKRQDAERFFTGSWNAGMTLLREYRAHKDRLVSMTERTNADETGGAAAAAAAASAAS